MSVKTLNREGASPQIILGAVCECHLKNNYDCDKATLARVQFYTKFILHVAKRNYKEDWQQRAQK